jgi:hypothetical protein
LETFPGDELNQMLQLATDGNKQLIEMQKITLEKDLRHLQF